MKRRQPNEDGSYAVVSMKTPAPIASPRQFKALGAWRLGAPFHVRRLGLAAFVAVATGVVIAAVTASIPSESLEGAVRRIDFASKLLTGIGLLAALTWALFKFVVSPGGLVDEIGETTYSNLKLDLALETAAYRSDLRVVTFAVSLENVGNVPIRAGARGCRMSVRQVPDNLPEGALVIPDAGEPLVDDFDLLSRYDSNSPYVIGPGVTYRESASVVSRAKRVVEASVTFCFADDEDGQTEHRLFRLD
jgi:hypothetical protein